VSDDILLLDGATEPELRETALGGGDVLAYTCPCPDKDTANEDTVAVIPYGPQAAVLIVADGAGGLPGGKRASLTAVTALNETLSAAMVRST